MDVKIKDFSVEMPIKNNGVEFDVSDNEGHIGDLYVTKAGLTWCEGKTSREKGHRLTWKEFIALMNKG